MDSVTQGLLGALTAQAISGKRFTFYVILMGVIAGTIGDLDILIRSSNPLTLITYHRQFTHSLIAIPIGGCLIAGIFLLFVPTMRSQWARVLIAATLAYGSHIFLDVLTSYGTQIYWPWSNERVTFNALPIVDPAITITLFLGLLFSLQKITYWRPWLPIILVLGYIGFSFYQHDQAKKAFLTKIPKGAVKIQVLPTIGQVYFWYGFYQYKGSIYFSVIHVPFLGSVYLQQISSFPLLTEDMLPSWVKDNEKALKDFRTFSWFSNSYLTKISDDPLTIANARYVRNIYPVTFLWGIRYLNQGDHVKLIWMLISKKMTCYCLARKLAAYPTIFEKASTQIVTSAFPCAKKVEA